MAAIACQAAKDWHQWGNLFDTYWFPWRIKGTVRISGQTRPSRNLRDIIQAMHQDMQDATTRAGQQPNPGALVSDISALSEGIPETEGAPRAQGGATRTEALHDRQLSQWTPQELQGLQKLAERIAQRLRKRLTRRWQTQSLGQKLDLRRTMRRSLSVGGLPVCPAWRQQYRQRPKLFILVDVSRSMENYAQLFLRIARAFVQAAQARAFVFHTRLTEVTPLLQRDSDRVQEKVNAVTAGFGGGTRIATSVNDFFQVHARRQINRSSRVWMLSDGFDADEPDQLAQSLGQLRRRGAELTWFHPTKARPASEAVKNAHTQSCIDHFVPLATLKDLQTAAAMLQ